MSAYTDVISGSPVQPTDVTFNKITISDADTNVQLYWPPQMETNNVTANLLQVDAQGGATGCSLTMPNAKLAPTYNYVIFINIGAEDVTVYDFDGNVILNSSDLQPGLAWLVYLTDNSTQAGEWGILQYGAGSSSASAAALQGQGITVLPLLNQGLNAELLVNSVNPLLTDYTILDTDRAKCISWTGGAGDIYLPLSTDPSIGNGFIVAVKNNTTSVNINLYTQGADTLDDSFNSSNPQTLAPTESAYYVLDANHHWSSIGKGLLQVNAVTLNQRNISSNVTLTPLECLSQIQLFTVTSGSNWIIDFQTVPQFYFIQNSSLSTGNIIVQDIAGTISTTIVPGNSYTFYSTTTDLIKAPTVPSGSPLYPGMAFDTNINAGFRYVNSGDANAPYIGVDINNSGNDPLLDLARFISAPFKGIGVQDTLSFLNSNTANATFLQYNKAGSYLDTYIENGLGTRLTTTQLLLKATLDTTPRLSFIGETNTGIAHPAAGELSLYLQAFESAVFSKPGISLQTEAAGGFIEYRNYSGGAGSSPNTLFNFVSGRGTAASITPVSNGDVLSKITTQGYYGATTPASGAGGATRIQVKAADTFVDSGHVGSNMEFYTTPAATATPPGTLALRLNTDQSVEIPNAGSLTVPIFRFTANSSTGTGIYQQPSSSQYFMNFASNSIGIFAIKSPGAATTAQMMINSANVTASTPAFAFATVDGSGNFTTTTTGLNYPAANNLGLVANSQIAARVTATNSAPIYGTLSLLDTGFPATAIPQFTFVNDADTGIYHPAADQIGIVLGGISAALLTASNILLRTTGTSNSVSILQASAGAVSPTTTLQLIGARNTLASPQQVLANDIIGSFIASGYNNAGTPAAVGASGIDLVAVSAFTASSSETKMNFYVTPNGSLTRTLAVTINSDQTVTFQKGIVINTGQLLLPNGTVGDPSYSFSSATNMGMYNNSGVLSFSVGGDKLALASTGFTFTSSGTTPLTSTIQNTLTNATGSTTSNLSLNAYTASTTGTLTNNFQFQSARGSGTGSLILNDIIGQFSFRGYSDSFNEVARIKITATDTFVTPNFYRGTSMEFAINETNTQTLRVGMTLVGAAGSGGAQAVFADGAVAFPSVRFSDATTGFYRLGGNSIGVAIAGALGAAFSAVGSDATGTSTRFSLYRQLSYPDGANPPVITTFENFRAQSVAGISGGASIQIQSIGGGRLFRYWNYSGTTAGSGSVGVMEFFFSRGLPSGMDPATPINNVANNVVIGGIASSGWGINVTTPGGDAYRGGGTVRFLTLEAFDDNGKAGTSIQFYATPISSGVASPTNQVLGMTLEIPTTTTRGQLIMNMGGGVSTPDVPSITFQNNTTTGIHLPSANQLGLCAGGASGLIILNNGSNPNQFAQVRIGENGTGISTAGTPAITFQLDLNTGIYRPGADQFGITTGGIGVAIFSTSSFTSTTTSASNAIPDYATFNAASTGSPAAVNMNFNLVGNAGTPSGAAANNIQFKTARGSGSTALKNNDVVGAIKFLGYNASMIQVAGISVQATQDYGTNSGSKMTFTVNQTNQPNQSFTPMVLEAPSGALWGQALFGNGTVGLPGISFQNSTDTGLYLTTGPDVLNVAVDGVRFGIFDAANGFTVPFGSSGGNLILNPTNIFMTQYSGSPSISPLPLFVINCSRGTSASHAAIASGDILLQIVAQGNVATSGGAPTWAQPSANIYFKASENFQGAPARNGANIEFWTAVNASGGAATSKMTLFNTGVLVVGATAQFVAGTTNIFQISTQGYQNVASTAWASTSDERVKHGIRDIEEALPLITQLKPRRFKYTKEHVEHSKAQSSTNFCAFNEDDDQYGFVADEVERVLPECVTVTDMQSGDHENIKIFDIHPISILMVKAVQELAQQNEDLKNQLLILTQRLDALEVK